jgi:hypothetical protein
MSDVPAVAIDQLTAPCALDEALRSWRGFVELLPSSQSKPGAPWIELADAPDARWPGC